MNRILTLSFGAILLLACEQQKERRHFFLDEYPQLEFRDSGGNTISSMFFIERSTINSVRVYQVRDTSLNLVETKSGEPYTGFIRTYHRNIYNIEAVFEQGKIKRLRFWHPNRQPGMDMDFRTGFGKAWTLSGTLAVNWTPDEIQLFNTINNSISQIITDSVTTYYNAGGQMVSYVISGDTASTRYYPDGTPQFQFPVRQGGQRTGVVKRWYPNGQLRAVGKYLNGEEAGIWTEYDSLGNVVREVDYSGEEP